MDLRGGFDQVLQVRAREEVAQVDEFAVAFVFDVNGAPAVLAAADGLAGDVDAVFAADDGEGDDGLLEKGWSVGVGKRGVLDEVILP